MNLAAGGNDADNFLKRLFDQITQRGLPDVLSRGIKHGDLFVRFYASHPASTKPETAYNWNANRFSVTR